MNVFEFRQNLVNEYAEFTRIKADDRSSSRSGIRTGVEGRTFAVRSIEEREHEDDGVKAGFLMPDPSSSWDPTHTAHEMQAWAEICLPPCPVPTRARANSVARHCRLSPVTPSAAPSFAPSSTPTMPAYTA